MNDHRHSRIGDPLRVCALIACLTAAADRLPDYARGSSDPRAAVEAQRPQRDPASHDGSGAASQGSIPRDPLPSWNEGPAKNAIQDFVAQVTTEGGRDFVPVAERVAAFDNDGTLWSEKPVYFQFQFALDRVKALAAQHPEWKEEEPFRSALNDDIPGILKGGYAGLVKLMGITHAGMSPDEFAAIVRHWLESARHPRFDRPYTELVYQPMLELLAYLRAHGFKTYIVSGGGIEFMRVFAERIYGVPPEQVIGTSIVTRFLLRDGQPVLLREPDVFFIDDKAGKPVGINRHIGRRPVATFGNSDGDLEMLQWTTAGPGPRFGLIVHHTDAVREWAYDRNSPVGGLAQALDQALRHGWTVVDMKQDWKVIYPFQQHAGSRDRPDGNPIKQPVPPLPTQPQTSRTPG